MAVRADGNPPILASEGQKSNPTTATLMADTGALKAGLYEVRLIIGANDTAVFVFQRRNAANGANVGAVPVIYCAAGLSPEYVLLVTAEEGERFRVMMQTNHTGTAAATIQAEAMS
jgi:hypothetical protein